MRKRQDEIVPCTPPASARSRIWTSTTQPNGNLIQSPTGSASSGLVDRLLQSAANRSKSAWPKSADLSVQSNVIIAPRSPATFRRKREVIQPSDGFSAAARPIRTEARTRFLPPSPKGDVVDQIVSDAASDIELIAAREGLSERSARMMLSLVFLAPDIVKAAVNGTLPRGFGVSRLTDLPGNWKEQRRTLGTHDAVLKSELPGGTVVPIDPVPSHDPLSRGVWRSN